MTKKQKKVLIRIIIAAVLIVALKLLFHFVTVNKYIELVAFFVPYFVIGYDILKKAIHGIFNGEVFDENFLMAIATVGAIALGEYVEGTAVMLFYQIGELFQSYAVGKSRKNITSLMDIRPDYANIEEDGKIEQVDPDDVEIGTIIIVKPGEKIPIDGVIVEGSSTLNTSALTGESVPRGAKEGDEVISGCVNLTGLLKIKTNKEFGDSTVSKILDLVENSSMKKSRSENFITRFAKIYTPAVCIGALVLAVLPPLVNLIMGNPAEWSKWLIRALTTLVISCPCALVISIPLSFFGGIGGASSRGILIKGSNYLEILSKTKIIDLSADFRLKDVKVYEEWYKIEHKAPQYIDEAVYGLCEINRDKVKDARIVANPGCYTTCSILTAYPLAKEGLIDMSTLIIDAKSGTSGAGRGAKLPNLYCEVNENIKAYGVATHRHTPEIEEQLGYAAGEKVVLNFTPHLVPMNRGILATEYAKLTKKVTYEEVKAIYDKYYADEKFVRVLEKDQCPETKWVEGSNYVDIGFKIDERTGRIIMMGAIDNLVKGAAGQAVQNMNLLFGLPESEGLELVPMFP